MKDVPQQRLPRHVAIIMDGNGRWAQGRGLLRTAGHDAGARTIRTVTTECARLGLEQLTLYAFSHENWKRPKLEITFLMKLLRRFLIEERPTLADNNVRLTAIGRLDDLPATARRELDRTIELSAANTGLNLCLALSYGGRAEIVDACRALAARVAAGTLSPRDIDEETISAAMYQPGRHPDLLIRTAGEMRVSNFLLWQISYTELFVTRACWPEFGVAELHAAFHDYATRVRKYGGLVDAADPGARDAAAPRPSAPPASPAPASPLSPGSRGR
ncbi:MAG TPA: polyprenyl diphosphate synthase [Planctomycetota bacterium]|nr:polyprenyl diphosphate synthase [Planctomycetota bacterium]